MWCSQALCGQSSDALRRSWAALRALAGDLGPISEALRAILADLGASECGLGPFLGPLWAVLGRSWDLCW